MLRKFGIRLTTIKHKPTQRGISFLNRLTAPSPPPNDKCGCESHCKFEKNKGLMEKHDNLSIYTDIGIIASCMSIGFFLKSSLVLPVGCGLIIAHRVGYVLPLQEEFKRKLEKYDKLCKQK